MSFTINDIPSLEGQVAVITGGNGGIGEMTARHFALKGCRKVYVLSRSPEKYEQALQRFKQSVEAAKSDASSKDAPGRWELVQCDLADLESVKAAANTISGKEERIDILLNNAGIMAVPYGLTKQGLEMQVGTNVVGHTLLSYMLLPRIVNAARHLKLSDATPTRSARIVQVSSEGHRSFGAPFPKQSWENLDRVNEELGNTWQRYGKSKVGNILLANQLQKLTEGENISHLSLHPGVINSNLFTTFADSLGFIGSIFKSLAGWFFMTTEQGSIASLFATTSPRVDADKLNGVYLNQKARVSKKAPFAEDKDNILGKQMIDFVHSFCKEKVDVDIFQIAEEALKGQNSK